LRERRVGVFLNLLTKHTRSIAAGVALYASERGNWSITVAQNLADFYVLIGEDDLAQLDGIIAGYSWERLPRVEAPIVFALTPDQSNSSATVCADNMAIGRLAASHLLSLGLPYFAFVGVERHTFSRERQQGFEQGLADRRRKALPPLLFSSWHDLVHGAEKLKHWLPTLLFPCAVFCADDRVASGVAGAARGLRIQVPEELAVLGVNDDDLACASTVPALSSIHPNSEQIGYEAARQLDHIMSGVSPNTCTVTRIAPQQVIQRGSTLVMGYDDPVVCEAMRLIQIRAPREPVMVDQIAAELRVQRQQLHRSFYECVGHSPKQEIDRVRGERLRALLLSTTMPMKQVAYEMGFGSPSQLIRFCRRVHSKTPLEIRGRPWLREQPASA
jgi:LacI family transcriptional regulator